MWRDLFNRAASADGGEIKQIAPRLSFHLSFKDHQVWTCKSWKNPKNVENDLAPDNVAENSEACARAGLFLNPRRSVRRARPAGG